jgi:hypothetical protein
VRRLLKYEIKPQGETIVVSGPGLRPLAVGWQGQKLVVWVEGHVPGSTEGSGHYVGERDYRFTAVFTGEDVPEGSYSYVGSAQRTHQELGFLVVHVYYGGIA